MAKGWVWWTRLRRSNEKCTSRSEVTQEEVSYGGDRLGRNRLPAPRVEWVEANEMRRESRGGFGETG